MKCSSAIRFRKIAINTWWSTLSKQPFISPQRTTLSRKIFLHIFECRMTASVYTETVGIVAKGWLINTPLRWAAPPPVSVYRRMTVSPEDAFSHWFRSIRSPCRVRLITKIPHLFNEVISLPWIPIPSMWFCRLFRLSCCLVSPVSADMPADRIVDCTGCGITARTCSSCYTPWF